MFPGKGRGGNESVVLPFCAEKVPMRCVRGQVLPPRLFFPLFCAFLLLEYGVRAAGTYGSHTFCMWTAGTFGVPRACGATPPQPGTPALSLIDFRNRKGQRLAHFPLKILRALCEACLQGSSRKSQKSRAIRTCPACFRLSAPGRLLLRPNDAL